MLQIYKGETRMASTGCYFHRIRYDSHEELIILSAERMLTRLFILILMMPVLAGCAGGLDFVRPGPVQSEFSRTLDSEYSGLATYVNGTLGDARLAHYFEGKAAKARAGQMPPPDDPSKAKLPDAMGLETSDAFAKLTASLNNGDWIDNGALLGLAQTRFDCWVGLAASSDRPGAGEGCKEKYLEAMVTLAQSNPPPQPATYTIYFNSDSIGLMPDEMEKVRYAARSIRGQEGWVAVLNGYTDTVEKQETSRNLSIRRAVSVRNALAQQGVAVKSILFNTFGKAPKGASGSPDIERRVDIQVMPAIMAASINPKRIEDLMPEHFGTMEPIF